MSEVITITKEELKAMIAAEVAKNSLPRVKKISVMLWFRGKNYQI
ncbi:Uncharacterised protein [Streptococcus dysgalactiae]|nr:hypothetical protein [Streptococcus dysgalactiae]SQB82513.1 Uncharacterised protein [Streptococcus dysgalactiae]